MTHTISVIQQHIDHGIPNHCDQCPLALALMQHFGKDVRVGKSFFYFEDYISVIFPHINLPTNAVCWMRDFDRGLKTMQPFTFDVEITK